MKISDIVTTTYNKFAQKYTKLYFDDHTDFPFVKNMFISKLPERAKVLDVGCGPGTFTKLLRDNSFDVIGIDTSKEMLKIARKKVTKVKFKLMDMKKTPFPDDYFDGIISAYSLIHIPTFEIVPTLFEFKRILKNNGLLYAICQKGQPDRIVDDPDMPSEKMFLNFFTRKRLNILLVQTGFTVLEQKEKQIKGVSSTADTFIYTLAKTG